MYLLFLVMIISNFSLLPIDNPHAVAVDIGIAINPTPVGFSVIKFLVIAKKTIVSNDFELVVNVLNFLIFFRFVVFIFEVCNHFF